MNVLNFGNRRVIKCIFFLLENIETITFYNSLWKAEAGLIMIFFLLSLSINYHKNITLLLITQKSKPHKLFNNAHFGIILFHS